MRRVRSIVFAMVAVVMSLEAWADSLPRYLIRPGDVLEIEFVGFPALRQRLPVAVDGTIRVPLAGSILVAGRNLAQIDQEIQTRLTTKSMKQITASGQEYYIMFDAGNILLTIVEYRPVYLTGDVSRPGQQMFRPGLTVRQAVSLAGGYDVMRFRTNDAFIQSSDFKAEYTTLWEDTARERMKILRVKSELAGDSDPPSFILKGIPIPASTLEELAGLERERFASNRAQYLAEINFLEEAIKQSETQLLVAKEQQAKEREGLGADQVDLNRMMELEKKGSTTSNRVTEARRSLLFSSTRYLQTTSQMGQLSRDQAELRRQRQRLGDIRRSELLKELQDSLARVSANAERLRSVSEKLAYTGAARSYQRGSGGELTIKIIRESEGSPVTVSADENGVLQPGDVVEVSLGLLDSQLYHVRPRFE